jgi:hypothetical protein
VEKFISTFEQLAIRTKGLSDEFYLECFLSGLNNAIRAHVCMHHTTTWLQACTLSLEDETIMQTQTLCSVVTNLLRLGYYFVPTQNLKVQKLSPTKMDEHRKKGICYYYDEKYSLGQKCHEQKLFQIEVSTLKSSEDILSYEATDTENTQPTVNISNLVPPLMEPEEPVISLHALVGIFSP